MRKSSLLVLVIFIAGCALRSKPSMDVAVEQSNPRVNKNWEEQRRWLQQYLAEHYPKPFVELSEEEQAEYRFMEEYFWEFCTWPLSASQPGISC